MGKDAVYYAYAPVRNNADTIPLMLDSLIKQDLPPQLINIVNDGSNDGTLNILNDYKKKV